MSGTNYRIDIVNADQYSLKTAPCGMNTIKYSDNKAPSGTELQEVLDLAKDGQAVLLSKWTGSGRLTGDYIVYGAVIK